MKVAVHNITGTETTKKVDLSKNVFGVEPNDHAIYLDVKQYLAALEEASQNAHRSICSHLLKSKVDLLEGLFFLTLMIYKFKWFFFS